jgi:type I restriction enzyme S subunit
MKKTKPKIRFCGYSEDWDDSNLGSIADFSKGKGYSKNDIRTDGYPIVLYGRLYTNYETVISQIDSFVNNKLNAVISKGMELVVPTSGETAEDICRASVIVNKDVIIGGDLNIISPKSHIDSIFLALSMSYGHQNSEMMKYAQGKTVVHLYASDLKKMNIKFPCYPEQSIIGTFFKSIDDLISKTQDKYEKTIKIKKACLEKMFPKKGEKVPEVRFEGFEGEWVCRKLDDCLEIRKERAKYHIKSICVDLENIESETSSLINCSTLNDVGSEKSVFYIDDILFGKLRPYLRKYFYAKFDGVCSTEIWVFFGKVNVDNGFMFCHIQRDYFISLANTTTGTKMPRADWNFLKDTDLLVPSLAEQTLIGNYFKQLDDLISLYRAELDKLKTIKKSLLERMFI